MEKKEPKTNYVFEKKVEYFVGLMSFNGSRKWINGESVNALNFYAAPPIGKACGFITIHRRFLYFSFTDCTATRKKFICQKIQRKFSFNVSINFFTTVLDKLFKFILSITRGY